MAMRLFGRETQHYYIHDVERLATWLGQSPYTATAEEVRSFQIEQQEVGMPVPTVNLMVSALRFFFTQTLDRPDLSRKLVRNRYERKIPTVLGMADVTHRFPDTDGFDRRIHIAEVDYIAGSEVAKRVLAENYVGLPLLRFDAVASRRGCPRCARPQPAPPDGD